MVDSEPERLVPLRDPQLDIDSDSSFTDFWRKAHKVIGGGKKQWGEGWIKAGKG